MFGRKLVWGRSCCETHSYGCSACIESLCGGNCAYLPKVSLITLRSCQPIFKRWCSFCPEAECSGPLFTQPLLHLLSCYYLVSFCFVSLCSIANRNYKGFVLCFGHYGTHLQISIHSSSSEGSATEVCVTPLRTSECKFTHKHLDR